MPDALIWGASGGMGQARALQKFIQHHSVEKSGVFVSSQFVNQQVQLMDFSLIQMGEIENPISGE
jgi:hypothetical protein